MLDHVLIAMQHLMIEINDQLDSTYLLNRYIALFNELCKRFHHTDQVQ